jgi:hypothetical protein
VTAVWPSDIKPTQFGQVGIVFWGNHVTNFYTATMTYKGNLGQPPPAGGSVGLVAFNDSGDTAFTYTFPSFRIVAYP